MALDVGDKRIGVALSDEGAVLATPRETLERKSQQKDVAHLLALAASETVSEIVVGMPYSLDGTTGPQAVKVSRFVEGLRAQTQLPVTVWDERLTTVAADEILARNGVPPRERRQSVDKIAAAVILQSYLDSKRAPSTEPEPAPLTER